MAKFKVTNKVSHFGGPDGKIYKPGDIIELPKKWGSKDFLEPVPEEEPKKK